MTLRIDKRLHLIVPIYKEEEGGEVVAYAHSTPISEETVDRYFIVLSQAYGMIFSNGGGIISGPAHAMRYLRHVATVGGNWFDDPKTNEIGVERGLVGEMRRLTMVAALDKNGKWESLPLDVAEQRNVISGEDKAEVENAIAFFTLASATLRRAQRRGILEAAAELWGAQISSSPFTEFFSSLKTSTATASTGESAPAPASEDSASANATVAGKPVSVPV